MTAVKKRSLRLWLLVCSATLVASLPYIRHAARLADPQSIQFGHMACQLKAEWSADLDVADNGVRFLLLSRSPLSSPWSRTRKVHIVQNLPIALHPTMPEARSSLAVEPIGNVEYAEISSFAGQPRVGSLSSSRYLGEFADGVIYFESPEDLREGFCVGRSI